ncbi:hypothetical protein LXA43DRAFT_1099474 [Ganoderma leucocontextum]|nr:hypothetical protein LXA43DRAFT_1099474 [Ganoderma leucocontextum]
MAAPYPAHFSGIERDWLVARLKEPDVQALLAAGGDSHLKPIADLVRHDFEKRWTGPYAGEDDLQYNHRQANAHKDKKADSPRRWPETQEAWRIRMGNLSYNIHRFVIEHFGTKPKRKTAPGPGPSIPLPDVEPPRKARRVSGLDVFQGDPSQQQAIATAASAFGKYAVGDVRMKAAKQSRGLPAEQRDPYETRARARNEERAAENAVQSAAAGYGEVSSPDTPLTSSAQVIAGWLKIMLERLGTMNWGGFICAGGPDANGEIRTYIDFIGHNRHGQNLLETVTRAAGFSEDELESVITLWLEQAKTTEPAPANSPECLTYQLLRALQIQKQKPHIPAPEILAAVLSEPLEVQKVAIHGSHQPAVPSPSNSALGSVAGETRAARSQPEGGAQAASSSSSTSGFGQNMIMGPGLVAPEPPLHRVSQLALPSTNSQRPYIPDPFADGPFGSPGAFTVDTSRINIDFAWGGDFVPLDVNTPRAIVTGTFLVYGVSFC